MLGKEHNNADALKVHSAVSQLPSREFFYSHHTLMKVFVKNSNKKIIIIIKCCLHLRCTNLILIIVLKINGVFHFW